MSKTKYFAPGSTILVTGADGGVASDIVDQVLSTGLKVKGTVRDVEKLTYIESVFHWRHAPSSSTAVVIPDFFIRRACDKALQDCEGIVHTAHEMSFQPDFATSFDTPVEGVENLLETAARIPSIKRFVYTNSLVRMVNHVLTAEHTLLKHHGIQSHWRQQKENLVIPCIMAWLFILLQRMLRSSSHGSSLKRRNRIFRLKRCSCPLQYWSNPHNRKAKRLPCSHVRTLSFQPEGVGFVCRWDFLTALTNGRCTRFSSTPRNCLAKAGCRKWDIKICRRRVSLIYIIDRLS